MQRTDSSTMIEVKAMLCLWWTGASIRSVHEQGQNSTCTSLCTVPKRYPNTAQLHCHHAIIEV